MFQYVAFFSVLSKSISANFCHLVDCSAQTTSNCSWPAIVQDSYYLPTQHPKTVDDPGHLFNWLDNPRMPHCAYLRIWSSNSSTGGYSIVLDLHCASAQMFAFGIGLSVELVQASTTPLAVSCFKRDADAERLGSECGLFAGVRLALTFVSERLLIQDLGRGVPTRLVLRKVDYVVDEECSCENLEKYQAAHQGCFWESDSKDNQALLDKQLRMGAVAGNKSLFRFSTSSDDRKDRNFKSSAVIMSIGASLGCMILMGRFCVFLYERYSARLVHSNRNIQTTRVAFITVN